MGPALVAAALAAFAGEHFTATTSIAALIPEWLPARVFIAWLVGFAHLAAALSFVARRFMRWSTIALAVMFGLFVLLMDLPGAISRPADPFSWMLAVFASLAFLVARRFERECRSRPEFITPAHSLSNLHTNAMSAPRAHMPKPGPPNA